MYGNKPDLSNLNFSVMYIKESDIVFLMSDGISDNFDPCVSGESFDVCNIVVPI